MTNIPKNPDNRQLRVLIIFGPLAIYGRERGTLRVAKALKDAGVGIHFIISKDWGALVENELKNDSFSYSTAHFGTNIDSNIFSYPRNIIFSLKALLSFPAALIKKAAEFRPTHILLGNCVEFSYALPALISLKTIIIYRLGDIVPGGLYGIIFRRIIAPRVKMFMCISEYIKGDALVNLVPREKLMVIYNFPPFIRRQPHPDNPIYRKDRKQIIITYVGQIHKYKGVGLFIEAAIGYVCQNADLTFYLAGECVDENPFGRNQLKRIKDLGLAGRIIFLGYVKDPQALLCESDIHCAPSLCNEPLGNVVLEAKAAGIPSVIFPDGGLPEMIEHKIDGFICRDKTLPALKEGISFFVDNKDNLANAKIKAIESLSKFDRQVLTDKWLDALWKTA